MGSWRPSIEALRQAIAVGLSPRRQIAGGLVAFVALPLLTLALVPLRDDLAVESVLLLYLLIVVATAAVGGVWPALVGGGRRRRTRELVLHPALPNAEHRRGRARLGLGRVSGRRNRRRPVRDGGGPQRVGVGGSTRRGSRARSSQRAPDRTPQRRIPRPTNTAGFDQGVGVEPASDRHPLVADRDGGVPRCHRGRHRSSQPARRQPPRHEPAPDGRTGPDAPAGRARRSGRQRHRLSRPARGSGRSSTSPTIFRSLWWIRDCSSVRSPTSSPMPCSGRRRASSSRSAPNRERQPWSSLSSITGRASRPMPRPHFHALPAAR